MQKKSHALNKPVAKKQDEIKKQDEAKKQEAKAAAESKPADTKADDKQPTSPAPVAEERRKGETFPAGKLSVKKCVRKMLLDGGEHTMEDFKKVSGGTEVTIRTALTDLKNPTYAGKEGAIPIIKVGDKWRLDDRRKSNTPKAEESEEAANSADSKDSEHSADERKDEQPAHQHAHA